MRRTLMGLFFLAIFVTVFAAVVGSLGRFSGSCDLEGHRIRAGETYVKNDTGSICGCRQDGYLQCVQVSDLIVVSQK